jgi:hypothetical protein
MVNILFIVTEKHGTEACIFLGLEHRLHSPYDKSIVVERTIEYLKDRTEAFDDCYYKNWSM